MVTVDIFLSVDGWARGTASPAYYGYAGPELQRWIDDELAKPQVILFGRRTYEALAAMPEEGRDATYARMSGHEKVVFSSTLQAASWENTRICRHDPAAEVRRLKSGAAAAPLLVRTMGSLSIARHLCAAGVVDRLRLLLFPLVLGPTGVEPFFAGMQSLALELAAHRVLDGRLLLVEYAPTGGAIPTA